MFSIKTVGNSGQISLGKKFAGQTVMIDEIQTGVWIVKLGRFIPDADPGSFIPPGYPLAQDMVDRVTRRVGKDDAARMVIAGVGIGPAPVCYRGHRSQ